MRGRGSSSTSLDAAPSDRQLRALLESGDGLNPRGWSKDDDDDVRMLPTWMVRAARILNGAKGRHPGRVAWEIKPPKHIESTNAIRGLYPWLAGKPLTARGPVFGRELLSGGLWCFDGWEQRKLKEVGDTGIFISGVIGSGKSAAAKSIVGRHLAFGRPFAVPADIRGEWVPLAEAVGGKVLRLGPGQPDRLNALAMPPMPAGMSEEQWWLIVRTHWQQLLRALAETLLPGQRPLDPVEVTAIQSALEDATGWRGASGNIRRLKPISLHPVVDLLRNPTAAMAEDVGMKVEDLREAVRHVALALRQLTDGPAQGLVDSPEAANIIDPSLPATVVDMSRVQSSDAAVALAMACTQSVFELAFVHQRQQWFNVYDELWRLSPFPRLLGRMNAGQRTSRTSGAANMFITHRASDSQMGGEESKQMMLNIIRDCATKIIYRQRSDAIPATREMVTLTDMVADVLPTMPQGRAAWIVDDKCFLVDHLLPPRQPGIGGVDRPINEWDVIETDQVLSDDYRGHTQTSDQMLEHLQVDSDTTTTAEPS